MAPFTSWLTVAGVLVHTPPCATTNRTVAPATGSLVRLSKTTPLGSMTVTLVEILRPQPMISTLNVSYELPSRIWSPAITGGLRTGNPPTSKMPVLGPVSIAIISSRSPFAPVMMMVRRSITSGNWLHDGAFARRNKSRPINAQGVGRWKPPSMKP